MEKLTINEIMEYCKGKTKAYEDVNGIKRLENADIPIEDYWVHRQVAEYMDEFLQYRAIGTPEECRAAVEILKEAHKKDCRCDKSEHCYGAPELCHSCDFRKRDAE